MNMSAAETSRQVNKQQEGRSRRRKFLVAARLLRSLNRRSKRGKKPATAKLQSVAQVMFLPDIAYCNEAGDIVASLQAWVYHHKSRRRLTHMLARIFGLDIAALDETTRQIFYARTQLFMVDSGEGCQLVVQDDKGRQHILPTTRSDGRTHHLVTLPENDGFGKIDQDACGKIRFQLDETGLSSRFCPINAPHDIACFFAPPHGVSIISDIDDTIKHSFVRDKKKLLRTTFLEQYRSVPEMCEWYQMLAGQAKAAFHYVSSSPIQLYPALQDFMRAEHYPEGSIHLREATRWSEVLPRPGSSKQHKKAVISRLLQNFSARQFILIGDSGGDDALIYAEFARSHPQQIAAICIRCVTPATERRIYDKIFADVAPDRWLVSNKVDEMRQFITDLRILPHE